MAAAAIAPLRVRVHYDFASSLCYVAHRVMQRMAGELAEIGVTLAWTPLDLARLVGPHQAGAAIPDSRRENALRWHSAFLRAWKKTQRSKKLGLSR